LLRLIFLDKADGCIEDHDGNDHPGIYVFPEEEGYYRCDQKDRDARRIETRGLVN